LGFGTQLARANALQENALRLISDAACGARLRASAGQGCGPHGSKEPHDATTFVQKPLFRTLRCIPHSDCLQRLLRASAAVWTEPWRASAWMASISLRLRSWPVTIMVASCISRPGRCIRFVRQQVPAR